jgi:hydroxymethylglutaryl-CoA reductase
LPAALAYKWEQCVVHEDEIMATKPTSRLAGLYNLSIQERLDQAAQAAGLSAELKSLYAEQNGLAPEQADHMIENVIGVFGLPLGIATNFQINGVDRLIPMAIEEPSVVAGASFMAKLARAGGGFQAESDPPEMIGQIQVLDLPDPEAAALSILEHEQELLDQANAADELLVNLGGGARALHIRMLKETAVGPMLIVHLLFDTRDAMGANAVNTALELLAPRIAELTGGRSHLRILSNLADHRLARARCRIPVESLAFDQFSGEAVRQGVIEAWAFAEADPYRATTHNKGIMNGIDAVVIATGNDWRAVEAGAHAYAARSGSYRSLSTWSAGQDGSLQGELELPLALGTIGGATRVHPLARANLALMQVENARELAQVVAAVGLAQNLAALRALASEGIQRGHMALHARQVAIAAGARGAQIEAIARRMVADGKVHIDQAEAYVRSGYNEE